MKTRRYQNPSLFDWGKLGCIVACGCVAYIFGRIFYPDCPKPTELTLKGYRRKL